jgi:hypothetical protein
MERDHMEDEEKDMMVLLRWILGTCLGTCDVDLTNLRHCFMEIIVIFDSITPQKALNRKTTRVWGEENLIVYNRTNMSAFLVCKLCVYVCVKVIGY